MNLTKIFAALLFLTAATAVSVAAELSFAPLFNSCSIYLKTESAKGCSIFYREKGTQKWLTPFEPVWDRSYGGRHRTCAVDLKPDTVYEVKAEIRWGKMRKNAEGTFRTWAEKVPIAKKIILTQKQVNNGYVIKAKGKPDGWILYTAAPGVVVKGDGKRQALLLDQAEYVIVENMTVKGGNNNAVFLNKCKYVRLRNLDISAWCDPGNWKFNKGTGRMVNSAGRTLSNKNGIYLNGGFGQVIERCYIHDPLLSSNSWRYGHPDGPQGISPWKPESTVIRYNDICGSDLKWWNDGIAGTGNFDLDGGLNKDCDVYGNFIAFANDDAIELDGGQQLVRCYRNHFENCFMGISIQGCMTGPSFVFENRVVDLGDELHSRSSAFKTANIWGGFYAASYFYNNTTDNANARLRLCRNFRIVAKNNILDEIVDAEATQFAFLGTRWENNLVKVKSSPKDMKGVPQYTNAARGIYTLKKSSPGAGKGAVVPGLNYKNPDLGVPRDLELPLRPFGLSLTDGRKACFTVKKGKASAPVKFTLKAAAPVKFAVRKSLDADWYEVTPAAASLKKGETLTITVKVKPEKMNSRIHYRSAFFLRTAEGWSRPVSVRAVTDYKYPETGNGMLTFKPGAPFKKVSGGGVRFDGENKKLEYKFTLTEPGGVFISLDVRALEPLGRHDSIRIGINGEKPSYCGLRGLNTKTYTRTTARSYKLPAGTHTVTLIPRESLDLKAVHIVTDVTADERR